MVRQTFDDDKEIIEPMVTGGGLVSVTIALTRFMTALYQIARALLVDGYCKLIYGRDCPVRYQLVWCDPREIVLSTRYFVPKSACFLKDGEDLDRRAIQAARRAFIASGDWDKHTTLIDNVALISRTKERYGDGASWEAVGEVDWMMSNIASRGEQDGCRTLADVYERCRTLDEVFETVTTMRHICTQRELSLFSFREKGGIGVAIDREGRPFWMDDGAHRLAMAQVLGLERIPVSLVMVHENAVLEGRVYQVVRREQQ